jgi:hypothetical protein
MQFEKGIQMNDHSISDPAPQTPSLSAWLKSEVTLRLPRWALVAGGAATLVLLLVALD